MNPVLGWGIDINLMFQSLGAALEAPMQAITFLGSELFFLFVLPVIYWCINATMGLHLGLLLMVSTSLYSTLKIAFHDPRPYWLDPGVRAYAEETSFGLPSGHAQNAVIVWGMLALWIRKTWAWIVAVIMILLIGLSRIYLGVHFPTDVLAGWTLGVLMLVAYAALRKPLSAWWRGQSLGRQTLVSFAFALGLILLGWLARTLLGDWALPQEWIDNARLAFPDSEIINPLVLSGIVTPAATFFGLALGAGLVQQRGGFDAGGQLWQRVVRFVVGILGTLVFYVGLDLVFPGGDTLVPLVLRFVRYALVGFWVSGLAPLVFLWLKLAKKP